MKSAAGPQAGQQHMAAAYRDVELEGNTCADCTRGRRAGQVGEVRRRALVEAYQAVIGPSAKVRQAQQPGEDGWIGHLDPGDELVAGPEGGYRGLGWIGISSGPGDSVQKHGVLALLCFAQQADDV